MTAASLPSPDQAEIQHSLKMIAFLKEKIQAQGGAITFQEWMQYALYQPGLGYYSSTRDKLASSNDQQYGHAPRGDFITAPELSPWFTHALARQVLQTLQVSAQYNILEFGAGSGALAAELLKTLNQELNKPATTNHHPSGSQTKIKYYILELSADLKALQQERLQDFSQQVIWLDQLPDEGMFSGCIIANEVLDAMPVRLVGYDQELNLIEKYVTLSPPIDQLTSAQLIAAPVQQNAYTNTTDRTSQHHLNSSFAWCDRALASDKTPIGIERLPILPNYISEFNDQGRAWIQQLGEMLKQGAIILIDYGFASSEYYHPQRDQGTLMCHYKHHAHSDPLIYPGIQDITAHVDFSAIAESAVQVGIEVLGYTSQANFLINCGLLELLQSLDPNNIQAFAKEMGPVQKLISEAEMGELFKVMLLGKELDLDPVGFHRADRRYQL